MNLNLTGNKIKEVLRQNKPALLLGAAIILILLVLGISFIKPYISNLAPEPTEKPTSKKVLVKVGSENIYQSNIDDLKKFYGYDTSVTDEATDKKILDTLVNESVALQAAKNENLLGDASVPENNSIETQIQRSQIVEKINQQIGEKSGYIEGTILTIWFYNGVPAKIGLEEGKKLAFAKLSKLQSQVKNKTITIEEAGKRIINDASLIDLDTNYQANAVWKFHNYLTDEISFDKNFDQAVKALNPGEVSDVILLKDTLPSSGETIESAYSFCQLTNKQDKGGNYTYQDWFNEKIKNYEVAYQ